MFRLICTVACLLMPSYGEDIYNPDVQGDIEYFLSKSSPSLCQQLNPDPDTAKHYPNKISREVKSGHYVVVTPTPLPNPHLVATTPSVASLASISEKMLQSDFFLHMFSGNLTDFSAFISPQTQMTNSDFPTWATPYALSIYGREMYDNCPFGNGNGYGDGRALSLLETFTAHHGRWELQIKGSGKTPFCRSGDGRAVLRSSVREFLASEAMFHLNVSTTRALSLIMSKTEQSKRPWYTKSLSFYPSFVSQNKNRYDVQPDVMIRENVAMTCRASPSYIRIGQIELFSRRYRRAVAEYKKIKNNMNERQVQLHRKEFVMMVKHMLFREYSDFDGVNFLSGTGAQGDDDDAAKDEKFQASVMFAIKESSRAIAALTASWVRVGYCQGNFNSDNCLVAGRTLDYGPFGFIERYDKEWNMWSGGGKPYSFRNQHIAGAKNFQSLATALLPLLSGTQQQEVLQTIIPNHMILAEKALNDVFRQKLGLLVWSPRSQEVFEQLDDAMEKAGADYTLFYRQLAHLPETFIAASKNDSSHFMRVGDDAELLKPFRTIVFYDELSDTVAINLTHALKCWIQLLLTELNNEYVVDSHLGGHTPALISSRMREVSPKYIPREWMLEKAYSDAYNMDFVKLHRLQRLFENPYSEQPDFEDEYYRRTPDESIGQGGIASMT